MISVIMPAYNEEKNIAAAIRSIENQTYDDYEMVIVNDGSQDNTGAIIREFAEKNPKITFLDPGKVGKNAAYNMASQQVKGDWLYFMGADDVLPPNAFQIWADAVKDLSSEEKIALRGRMKVVSNSKKYDGLILPRNKARENFSGPLTLLSREMHKFILPIPQEYPNEDTWWALCISYFAEKKIMLDDIVVWYHIHDGNAISRNSDYKTFNEKYHIRYIARKKFLERFDTDLSQEAKQILNRELQCEEYRYAQKTGKLLTVKGLKLQQLLRFLVFSNAGLYTLKKRLDRLFLGH